MANKEFDILKSVLRKNNDPQVILDNGDDAAVINFDSPFAVSTDNFVSGVHFDLNYFSLQQLAKKVVHASCSDLVATNALPQYLLLAISAPESFAPGLKDFIDYVYQAAAEINVKLIGGDLTAAGSDICINATAFGKTRGKVLTRSTANIGDYILLSGDTGCSMAGLELIKKGIRNPLVTSHLDVNCRLDLLSSLDPATSGIDISDGLASELNHLAHNSQLDFEIDLNKIPVSDLLKQAENILERKLIDYVLEGGEEYQLLITSTSEVPGFTVIGKVKSGSGKVVTKSGEVLTSSGYQHF